MQLAPGRTDQLSSNGMLVHGNNCYICYISLGNVSLWSQQCEEALLPMVIILYQNQKYNVCGFMYLEFTC